jgi:hypothetical protein
MAARRRRWPVQWRNFDYEGDLYRPALRRPARMAGGEHNSSTLPSKSPHLGLNSIRIKRTSLRVCFTNVTDSGQSNSASVRRQKLRPTLSTIGVLHSSHPADAPRPRRGDPTETPFPLRGGPQPAETARPLNSAIPFPSSFYNDRLAEIEQGSKRGLIRTRRSPPHKRSARCLR